MLEELPLFMAIPRIPSLPLIVVANCSAILAAKLPSPTGYHCALAFKALLAPLIAPSSTLFASPPSVWLYYLCCTKSPILTIFQSICFVEGFIRHLHALLVLTALVASYFFALLAQNCCHNQILQE